MPAFLSQDFLLHSETARRLYFEYAAGCPIFDYHSHLDPGDIAADRRFDNLTEIWLDGDHYKWRAMRTAGIDERLITGNAAPFARFAAFAEIVPLCIGNPLYHWTHMELKRPFGIADLRLSGATAAQVWDRCNARLAEDGFSAQGILNQSKVALVCTTDDPADSLAEHVAMATAGATKLRLLPTWRPDALLKPGSDSFLPWLERLGEVVGNEVGSVPDLLAALEQRLAHFAAHGCVSADHGIDRFEFAANGPGLESIFEKCRRGAALTHAEVVAWQSRLLLWLGKKYAERGWVMQLHIGALRDNSARMRALAGANAGFDSIGDYPFAAALALFLDALDCEASLPKTILYCLNPRDNEMLATMAGNFQGGGIGGKVQFGSAWWFNDQADGIVRQLVSVAQMSLLSRFVGMLTDSRSLLSFSRHEYFRRILCNLIGGWVEAGEAPADDDLLGNMIRDICFRNTVAYFGFDSPASPG